MKKYQIILIISACYALLLSIGVIPKEGYGGALNELLTLAGMWYMGAWYEAAHTNDMFEEEDDEYDA